MGGGVGGGGGGGLGGLGGGGLGGSGLGGEGGGAGGGGRTTTKSFLLSMGGEVIGLLGWKMQVVLDVAFVSTTVVLSSETDSPPQPLPRARLKV